MKYACLVVVASLGVPAVGFAQDASASGMAGSENVATVEPADAAPAKEESDNERSVYSRKVRGLLWIEGFVGPTSYDPDQFGSLSLSSDIPSAPRRTGAEWGFAAGVGLGGFWLGAFYRQADFDAYKLGKVGLDIQGVFRFIPFVHPMVRLDLFYATAFGGNPYGSDLTDVDIDGGGFTVGAGLRIPIIRWMSFAATVDWSFIGLAVRATPAGGGDREKGGVTGQQIGATFALTFHFIGVRGGD
ncbi:MAG: hypothetical protein AAF436_15665 [Myxococcota bacterium]